jgi:hypothetical protein
MTLTYWISNKPRKKSLLKEEKEEKEKHNSRNGD